MKRNSYLSYLKNVIFKKNDLVALTYFVTNRCNLSCEHCFQWRKLNQVNNELSLEEIKKITKGIGKLLSLFISGGEPFLREDFAEIIKLFYSNCGIKNINIPTNGTLKDKILRDAEAILSACPKLAVNISISIDNIGDKHDQIRGQKMVFDKAIATYLELKKLKSRYHNLHVELNTTLSASNQNDIESIYNYVKNILQPDSYGIVPVRGNIRQEKIKDIDITIYEKIINRLNSDYLKQNMRGFSNFSFSKYVLSLRLIASGIVSKIIKKNAYQLPCYAARLSGVLYSNGDIFPCELLDKPIGNIREYGYDLRKAWNARKIKDIRKFIQQSKCFCIHPCNLTINILFSLRFLPKIICYGLIMSSRDKK